MADNYQSRSYPLVITALIVAEATAAFEIAMLTSAVPSLITEFDIRTTDVGWAFTGFTLVAAASAAIGGRLGDLFGRKKVLLTVLLGSVLGSVVSVGIGTFPAIIAGRAIQGVSGAVLPLVVGMSREAVESRRVPVTIAVVAGTATLAGGAGYFVSGVLIQFATWEAIFVAAASLATFAFVLCHFCLSPSPVTHVRGERIDIVGAALFVPALMLVFYGVTASQTSGWGSPAVLGTVVAGAALCAFWVWWELRVPNPMLNLRLLAVPKYALAMGVIAFFALGAIGGMQLLQPLLFQSPTSAPVGLGMRPSLFGTVAFGLAILGFLFAPVSGVIARRVGAKRSMFLGMAVLVVAVPGHFLLRDSFPLMVVVLASTAVGVTFVLTGIPNLLAEVLPKENMSEGMGFAVVIRNFFQAVSLSVFAVALSSSVVPGTRLPQVGAYGLAIGTGTAAVLVGLVLVFLVRGGNPSSVRV
ncbi:MAG: MFS transporter [Umezawaea sp.]